MATKLDLVQKLSDAMANEGMELPLTAAQKAHLEHLMEKYGDQPEGGIPWPELRERLMRRVASRPAT